MTTPKIPGFDPGPLRDLARWKRAEYAFWLLPIVGYFAFAAHCSRSRSTSSSATPASSRWAMPPSSASAPMPRA